MRKISAYLGIIAAAAMTLVSCAKEVENPNYVEEPVIKEGVPFQIVANTATKTTIDGLQTEWAADDEISLLHASASTPDVYVNDGKFTIAQEDLGTGTFRGTINPALTSGSYNWYAVYPYNKYLESINNTGTNPARYYIGKRSDQAQEQTGNSSTAHLCGTNYPLYGKVTGIAYNATPSMNLSHIASFIEVKVTNKNDTPLTVTSVAFTAPEGKAIVGQYNINFAADPIANPDAITTYSTFVGDVANLTVKEGAPIEKDEYATFYIGVKPFETSAGDDIKVSVNGYEKTIHTTKKFTFASGMMKTVNFDFDQNDTPVVVPSGTEYEKITDVNDLTEGEYLIVNEENGVAFDGSLDSFDAIGNTVDVTINSDVIAGTATIDAAVFTIAEVTGGYSIMGTSGKYIGHASDANGLTTSEIALANSIDFDANGNADIVGSGGAYLRYNSASNQTRFRYYKSSSYSGQKPVTLYKKVGAVKQNATVTITGTIPTDPMAKGDTFEFTASTTSDATEFNVTLSSDDAATVAPKTGSANTWVVTAGEPDQETEVTLTVSVAATANYKAASDTKTFTVAKKVVTPSSGDYVKITSTSDLEDAEYLIVYEDGSLAFDGSLDELDAIGNSVAVTIDGGTIASSNAIDAAVFTIEAVTGGYSVLSASGQYIGQTSDANGLASSDATVYVNTISFDSDGNADIVGSGGAHLRYNSASNQTRFRYYKSSSYTGQKAVALYKKTGSASVKQDPTLTINGTIPTDPMAKDETFEFSVTTNSDAAPTATLSPAGAATIAAKNGAANTWIVTAGEPDDDTEVTLTVSVAATANFKAANATRTFTVAKKYVDPNVKGTENNPYTVAEAIAFIETLGNSTSSDVYVAGIVSQVDEVNLSFHNATYWISDDGTTTTQMEVYRGKYLNGANFTSADQIGVGDIVTIVGKLKKYNTTPEFDQGSSIVSIQQDNSPKFGATISSEANVAAAGGTKTITVTGNVAWTASATNNATVSPASGTGAGTITVTIPSTTITDTEPVYVVTVSTSANVAQKTYQFSIHQNSYVAPSGSDVTDVLTAVDLAATSTSYTEFSGVTKTSNAVYAGQSAKSSEGYIQLRSNNSNSGIVSTTSGGKVKSVKIVVGKGDKTIDVYGTNTPYTSATNLYATQGNNNQGTKIGSLSATGTIDFTDEYEYIGIRSNSGAVYISQIEITWTD